MRKHTIKEIISDGLTIKPETLADAENIYKYMGCDPEITRYTGWNPYQTLQATQDKIREDIRDDADTYSWVIKKEDEFIGTIGAYDYKEADESIEIGYSIVRKHWGNGYAGIAAKSVVRFLQDEAQIKKIRAWSHKDNTASKKVLLGIGFKAIKEENEQITFEKSE